MFIPTLLQTLTLHFIYMVPYAYRQRRFLLTIYIALLPTALTAAQAGFRTRRITTVAITITRNPLSLPGISIILTTTTILVTLIMMTLTTTMMMMMLMLMMTMTMMMTMIPIPLKRACCQVINQYHSNTCLIDDNYERLLFILTISPTRTTPHQRGTVVRAVERGGHKCKDTAIFWDSPRF